MKSFRYVSILVGLFFAAGRAGAAPTPIVDGQMSGSANQVQSGATLTVKSGATLAIEAGGTVSGLDLAALAGDLFSENTKVDVLQAAEFASDAGSTDTYVATLAPAPAAYVTGVHYRFRANTANTGAATINFNSLGAKTIKKSVGGLSTTLADNDIRAGDWVDVVYDGTYMQIKSLLGNAADLTGYFSTSTKADVLQAAEFAADAGSNDTYVATLSPAITAYGTGVHYWFKANTNNTGAATLNLNGLGAKTIVKLAGGITTTLADNDIRAGQWVEVVYDGTNMQMQSPLGNVGGTGDMLLGTAQTVTTAKTFNTGTLKLGSSGDLVDENGNELFKFTATTSAVNEITIANAATGSGPSITATGGDTNIDMLFRPKGTGTWTVRAGVAANGVFKFDTDPTGTSSSAIKVYAQNTLGLTMGTSTTTGALITGAGSGDGAILSPGSLFFSSDGGTTAAGKFVTSTGQFLLPKNITSTSSTTGTLVITGGLGLSENINIGGQLRVATKTPSSASDTGVAGTFCWDASFIYICTATNTWKRVAIATW